MDSELRCGSLSLGFCVGESVPVWRQTIGDAGTAFPYMIKKQDTFTT